MEQNVDLVTTDGDGQKTMTSASLVETTELADKAESEGVNVEVVSVEVASVEVKSMEVKGMDDTTQSDKESLPKSSQKRKLRHVSGDRSQKDTPAGKRVLLSPSKRPLHKWQKYKKPTTPRLCRSKKKRMSPKSSKPPENVPSAQSCETGHSTGGEQMESGRVPRTDVTQSATIDSVLNCVRECKENTGQQTEAGQCLDSGSTVGTVDVPVVVIAPLSPDTESQQSLDVSLKIDIGDVDQGADTGLCHLKQLTEELSQLGRDSARLVTSRQSRKTKKRKQKSDEHVSGQQAGRRTSSPMRNVKQHTNSDPSEAAFAEELGLIASHDKGRDVSGAVPDNAPQGDSEGGMSVAKEMVSIDETLEEKSKRFLLTAKNVRSIVHELVTNEQVLAMMCNTLDEGHDDDQPKQVVYEPKMTRSKVKEVIEMGQVPSPWILSPIKGSNKAAAAEPHFLEMTFSEDEEDEEYKPSEDELKAYAEVGTPASVLSTSQEGTVDLSYGRSDDDSQTGVGETATIAWRTRSKLPLQDTPLEQIELGFVAPDISADMYDTYCDDTDWKNFLCSIVKSDGRPDVNDSLDDEADPEYNFLAEVEKEEVDAEDFRNDRDVRVTKKELHELMDELFEAYGAGFEQHPDVKSTKDAAKTKKQKGSSDATGPQIKFVGDLVTVKVDPSASDGSQDNDPVPWVTDEEKVQIEDQMRKHVQLLAQTYVQAAGRPELAELSGIAQHYLMELKAFGDKKTSLSPGVTSFFHPCNLTAALDVVSCKLPDPDEACNQNLKELMVANYVPKHAYEIYGLSYEQMQVFMTSPAFMFPQMLPECRLLQVEHHGNKRVLFSEAEDNLLAMGIDQFGHLQNKYAYIETYMLPTKKKQQLRYRLKNLKADRTHSENSLKVKYLQKYLSKHNKLPEFPRYLELEDPSEVVPPQDRDPDLLPEWWNAFQAARLNHQSNCQSELTGVTGWVQVVSVAPPTDTAEKETSQMKKKRPPAPSRPPSSRKIGVSGLNRFRTTKVKKAKKSASSPVSPVLPPVSAVPTITTSATNLCRDTVTPPISDSQENTLTATQTSCKVKPGVVINAAVLSPGSLLGGATVKMATVIRPGFRATSPTDSNPAVDIDEPLIMLTARQLSQLGVKINMMSAGGDTTVQLSSPSRKGTLASIGGTVTRNTLLSSTEMQDRVADSECTILSSVSLSSVTLSTSATTIRCSSVVSSSEKSGACVTHRSDSVPSNVDYTPGDIVGVTHGQDVDMTDATDVSTVNTCHDVTIPADVGSIDTPCRDDTAAAGDMELSFTPVINVNVDSPVTVTTSDTVTMTTTPNKPVKCVITDGVVSPAVVPRVVAALTDSQNRTPKKIPSTPSPEKMSPSKRSLFYNSPSRKATVFHRLHKPQDDPPKARRTIDILPHPSPDFSVGSPFYQSPSKQITFVQPAGGSSGFAGVDVSVSRNLAFSLRSPSKTGIAGGRRGHAIYVSPVKKAAAKITARLKKVRKIRKLERILPKPAEPVLAPVLAPHVVETEQCHTHVGDVGSSDASMARFGLDAAGEKADSPRRPPMEPVTLREEVVAMESESDGESVKGAASRPESATEFDDDDNDDEDHLAQLMAASTTIRFAPKLPLSETDICLTKAKKKRAVLLELLVPDLLAKDPLRDERDTAFAQAYLTRAKDVLLGNCKADTYEQLLKLLHDFGQSDKSPVELYQQLRTVLTDFPELVQEFVVFLLPEQAKECDCFMENLECQRARTFLRKLEVHLRKHPSHLQKIINIFLQWQNSVNRDASRDVSRLKEAIRPLLRGQQHLLEEFCWFFCDEQPPQSSLTEFEEVTLKDSDDDDLEDDDYEEVELPEGDELLGSQWCVCPCHQSDVLLFNRRKKHCRACRSSGIKIIKGRIYVQTSESSLKPARVVYHSPEDARGDPAHTDTRSTQSQTRSNEEAAKMELGVEDAGHLTLGTVTRQPEHAHKSHVTLVGSGSRPHTPTPGGDTMRTPRTDSGHGECVVDTGGPGHVVSDRGEPPVAGMQTGSGNISQTLAGAQTGSGGICGGDVVVQGVEAGRQLDWSLSGVSGPTGPECVWTKEEDKHILESCKQHGLGGSTFQTVAAALKKSAESVSKRFYELMQLFNEQPSDPSENDSDIESDGSPIG